MGPRYRVNQTLTLYSIRAGSAIRGRAGLPLTPRPPLPQGERGSKTLRGERNFAWAADGPRVQYTGFEVGGDGRAGLPLTPRPPLPQGERGSKTGCAGQGIFVWGGREVRLSRAGPRVCIQVSKLAETGGRVYHTRPLTTRKPLKEEEPPVYREATRPLARRGSNSGYHRRSSHKGRGGARHCAGQGISAPSPTSGRWVVAGPRVCIQVSKLAGTGGRVYPSPPPLSHKGRGGDIDCAGQGISRGRRMGPSPTRLGGAGGGARHCAGQGIFVWAADGPRACIQVSKLAGTGGRVYPSPPGPLSHKGRGGARPCAGQGILCGRRMGPVCVYDRPWLYDAGASC